MGLIRRATICSKLATMLLAFQFFWILISASSDHFEREEGVRMLHQGNLKAAMEHLQRAVDQDPSDHLACFNLATAYFASQNMQRAKELFQKALDLRKDFTDSMHHLVNVFVKQGLYDDASRYLAKLLSHEETTQAKRKQYLDKRQLLKKLKSRLLAAEQKRNAGDLDAAAKAITELLEHSDCSTHLYKQRSLLYEKRGQYVNAIDDLRHMIRLAPHAIERTEWIYNIAKMYLFEGMLDESIKWIRDCLAIDMANEQCHPIFFKLKPLRKNVAKIEEAIEADDYKTCIDLCQRTKFVSNDSSIDNAVKAMIHGYNCRCLLHASEDQNEVISLCTDAIAMSKRVDPHVFASRAEAYLNLRNWDNAMADYRKLKESGYTDMAEEGFKRVNLLKNRKGEDYYELLGVSRTATVAQINRAFRKMAKLHHPDGKNTAKEKADADEIFKRMVAAKDVLTDKEKRERYDNGEDPNGPSVGAHGGDPFGSFHFPGGGDNFFGGSGFTFRFVYQ